MIADEICDSVPDAKERAKCRERAARVLWNLLVSCEDDWGLTTHGLLHTVG